MLVDRLYITMFGGLAIHQATREINRFRTRKAGALVSLLAYYCGRPQSRELLIDHLWPDKDIHDARNLLSVTLNSLRNQLEPPGGAGGVLYADRHEVRLIPEAVSTDVAMFMNEVGLAASAGTNAILHLKRAVEIYRGELLPGYYEEWIFSERELLAGRFRAALSRLARLCEDAGEIHDALTYARQAVAQDPLHEPALRDLLKLYIKTGRHAEAHARYAVFCDALQEIAGAQPEPETVELAAQFGQNAGASKRPVDGTGASAGPHATQDSIAATDLQRTRSGSLPAPLTRFFGRHAEMDLLTAFLTASACGTAGPRLITLTGTGGSGKTRLAVEAAASVRDKFAGGVWFVPLADITEADQVIVAIQNTLGLARDTIVTPEDQVARLLSVDSALLVLDNFEQLLTAYAAHAAPAADAALMVRDLLVRVPSLTCVVTSRERLNISGEQEFAVSMLATPGSDDWKTANLSGGRYISETHRQKLQPADLLPFPSVQLFVDRARARKIDFTITAGNADAVAELCSQLEGMPLALELAAAWAHTLTPAQMLERLTNRFDLLVSRGRDLPFRHRSLRAALEGSYRLLTPGQQRLFVQLSAFYGGWTLRLAEAICLPQCAAPTGLPDGYNVSSPLSDLARLVDASLIIMDDSCVEARYRFLETIRQYAAEQVTFDEKAELALRHAEIIATMAESAEPGLYGPDLPARLDRLDQEYENIRAALAWCLENPVGRTIGLRLVGALRLFWYLRNRKDGRYWANALLAAPGSADASLARARALCIPALVTPWGSDFAGAVEYAEESVNICREHGYDEQMPASCVALAHSVLNSPKLRRPERLRQLEESLELSLGMCADSGDLHSQLTVLHTLCLVKEGRHDMGAARMRCEQALELARRTADPVGIARCLHTLAQFSEDAHLWKQARAFCEERLKYERLMAHWYGMSHALYSRGCACLQLGEPEIALSSFQESLMVEYERSSSGMIASHLYFIGAALVMTGNHERAARILGAAERIGEEHGINRHKAYRWDKRWDAALDGLQEGLDEQTASACRQQGYDLSTEDAVALALEE